MNQWKNEDRTESRYGGVKRGVRVEVDQWKREDTKESGYGREERKESRGGGERRERRVEAEERREKGEQRWSSGRKKTGRRVDMEEKGKESTGASVEERTGR